MTAQQTQNQITPQRWLALFLLALEVGAIGFLSRTYLIPIAVITIGFVGAFSRIRISMTRQRTYDAIALVGIVYIFNYVFLPENSRYEQLFVSQQIAFNVSLFALTIQALLFFVKRRNDFLPFMFPALGVIALVCAAIVQVSASERFVFQLLCVGFAMVTSLFCDASRRRVDKRTRGKSGRAVSTGLALLLVGGTGWFLSTSLHRYEHQMDRFVRRFLQPGRNDSSIGFSETASLGSVSLQKGHNAKQIALRVVSPVKPGYLRGRAYDIYKDHNWAMVAVERSLPQLAKPPEGIKESSHLGGYFQLGPKQPNLYRFEIWPAFGGTYMAPLGSSYVKANSFMLDVDSHGILRSRSASAGVPYSIYAKGSGPGSDIIRTLDTARDSRLSAIPEWANENPEIQQLAATIFKHAKSTSQKIDAVKSYFRDNYHYSLKVTIPSNYKDDPLKWFLLTKSDAYCEYFASGTALLLRMAGVRCRYVTGYVVEELNAFSGDWVARNKDAHAWVEAFDEDRGWITVESTPTDGIPHGSQIEQSDQFSEYLKDRLQRLRAAWQQHGVRLIGHVLLAIVTNPTGAFVLFLCIAFFIRRAYKKRKKTTRKKAPAPPLQEIVTLNQSLSRIEKQAKKHVDGRAASETIAQFATRLEGASTNPALQYVALWLREYSKLRYSEDRAPNKVVQLQTDAKTLVKELSRKHQQ